jgi:hypothetical protein
MNRSESIGNLGKALAKAQTQLTNVKVDSQNPHFKSKYASLTAVNETVLPILSANGIAVLQGVSSPDVKCVGVSTTFIHGESGEWWTEELFLPPTKVDPQGFGSAITYGRRYLLMAMAGVATDDDDANEASKPQQTQQAHRQPQVPAVEQKKAVMPAASKEESYPAEWKTPADAQAWAVSNKHCTNEFEAKASFKNSLKDVTGQDGKLDSNQLAAVLENFYKKHMARQSEQQLKAA